MDISADKYRSDLNRPAPFSAVLQTLKNFTRWLIGFFVLTEEEQSKAGIYVGSKRRNE
jgi:hypothetical protein